ncbi:hypothetical protein [Deinococcus aquaedulcis]|uniref:hypothetical protein n=1 Tax=Deinococcus aquaedulcis TaxID=2840455 RepID=UPI001F45F991|nr:hypothetical protein [Deinococcus aquaedulcis]
MIVETKIVGRRTPFERRPLEVPAGPQTLRSLLIHLVEQEVAAYHERQNSVGVLRVLTERELSEATLTGRVSTSPQAPGGTVSTEDAVRTALTGFGDGLYYVFVDDEQVETLDTPLTLRPDSTLLLVRLTALTGG